ncbi:MAG: hypothetical protein ABJC24_04260 [Chloroflexota bacterium]
MDEIGQRYLLLALRLGRHLPDFVHAYVGPPALREVVQGEALTPPVELHDEALRLLELAEAEAFGGASTRRATFLRGQLTAIGTMARLLGGEQIAFTDRVELLLGCMFEPAPDSAFGAATSALSDLLPGDGTLLERVAQHDASLTPPRNRVLGEMTEFTRTLRRRSDHEWGLPPGEGVEWNKVKGRAYVTFSRYVSRTQMEFDLAIPLTLSDMLHFAAHEIYPGHHLERATKESRLASNGERGESMVLLTCTPQLLVLEGMAEHALRLVMTELEIVSELQAAAARSGLRGDLAVDRAAVGPADVLGWAVVAAALAHNEGSWTPRVTRDYLREVGLVSESVADRWTSLFDDPIRAVQPLTYPIGASLCGRWLEVVGQSEGVRRYLDEELVPSQLLQEIGEPRALFPGSLA